MAKRTSSAAGAAPTVAGVTISHPERVLYPECKLTKLDIARYYESVADLMLPQVADRLLTLLRCPAGAAAECFYQKHVEAGLSKRMGSVKIREKSGTGVYRTVSDAAGIVSLIQFGVLEIHIWGSRGDDVERPDRLVFDLDPDPSVSWNRVVAAVRMLRERFRDLGLESFLKTTGGKGLHVVVPIRRRDTWGPAKEFCRKLVDGIVADEPERYTANLLKKARAGRIFIDYLRNERGATWIAPYSTRARPAAPVSAPLSWDELGPKIHGDTFTVKNLPARLAKLKRDPWEGIDKLRQSITAKMKKAVGV